MDTQRKTIQNLAVTLDETRGQLALFYRTFGEKLLNDSADPAVVSGGVSTENLDLWRSLMSSREDDTRSILDIKAAVTRRQELIQFRKEIAKKIAEENAGYRDQILKLGQAFFEQYTDADAAFFGETYSKADAEKKKIGQLTEKKKKLQNDSESKRIFGKMVDKVKIASAAGEIQQHEAVLNRILEDAAEEMIQTGAIEKMEESGAISSEILQVYTETRPFLDRIDDLKKRTDVLDSDSEAMNEIFKTNGVKENPQRRIEDLHARIKETDNRIDSLCVLCAREYCDKFLDEDGKYLAGKPAKDTDDNAIKMYQSQLEKAALLRTDIFRIRQKIEVLETDLKIQTLERNITVYKHTIEDHEKKISHYNDLKKTLKKSIADAEKESAQLAEHKAEIEKQLGQG
ncbi:hypothetical protein K7I13_13250 [Brucepastera parasyntrophica]|uniref:hypothetical protein n=1 Tax=Brucepastera parasyntrophica TaxID=2880008 RepID=UPI002108C5F8|nr:hypothetical protein [Brucepastera parasyntrophica]ULQ59430.1 hypothetical protein K7I13_13250 [Brucepastera parasyntrophica]